MWELMTNKSLEESLFVGFFPQNERGNYIEVKLFPKSIIGNPQFYLLIELISIDFLNFYGSTVDTTVVYGPLGAYSSRSVCFNKFFFFL